MYSWYVVRTTSSSSKSIECHGWLAGDAVPRERCKRNERKESVCVCVDAFRFISQSVSAKNKKDKKECKEYLEIHRDSTLRYLRDTRGESVSGFDRLEI